MTVSGNPSGPRVIVALDYANAGEALAFSACVAPGQCRLKVGFELFTAAGPSIVETLVKQGFDVFLDLKFHDIPNTVARACSTAAALGVWMLNVHTLGGRAMMEAARESLERTSRRPLLIGVTVLTSHTLKDLSEIGFDRAPDQRVLALARLARSSGLDGVVCSAQEAGMLQAEIAKPFCLVTPGIRPSESEVDDQRRVMTPSAAIHAGADYLVVGRPIIRARDPLAALIRINDELDAAVSSM